MTATAQEPPLTVQEIAALPEGTRLIVLWSGGNGPWEYRLASYRGSPTAQSDHEFDLGIIDWPVKRLDDYVGTHPQTQVWLA